MTAFYHFSCSTGQSKFQWTATLLLERNKVQLKLLSKWAGILVFILDEAAYSFIRSAHAHISELGITLKNYTMNWDQTVLLAFIKLIKKSSKSNHYLESYLTNAFHLSNL